MPFKIKIFIFKSYIIKENIHGGCNMPEFSLESLQNNSLIIGILILATIACIPSLVLPLVSIYYIGDVYTSVGMMAASIYLLVKEKEELELRKKFKLILILAIIGGIIVSIFLTIIYLLMIIAIGGAIDIEALFIFYFRYSILVTLGAGTFIFLCYCFYNEIRQKKKKIDINH